MATRREFLKQTGLLAAAAGVLPTAFTEAKIQATETRRSKRMIITDNLKISYERRWIAFTEHYGTLCEDPDTFDPDYCNCDLGEGEKWELKATWCYSWCDEDYKGGFDSKQDAFEDAYYDLFDLIYDELFGSDEPYINDPKHEAEINKLWIEYGKANKLHTRFISRGTRGL
jgi:hypothetical protein